MNHLLSFRQKCKNRITANSNLYAITFLNQFGAIDSLFRYVNNLFFTYFCSALAVIPSANEQTPDLVETVIKHQWVFLE